MDLALKTFKIKLGGVKMVRIKTTKKMKKYVLMGGNGPPGGVPPDSSVFTGWSPRQAALKAASRGITDIRLFEKGRRNRDETYTIHIFRGAVREAEAPSNRPSWMPTRIKKATVSKVRSRRVGEI